MMNQISGVMTRKGQVTIPSEIRRALGLREGDRVLFSMEDDEVRIKRAGSVVDQTAGMLKGDEPPISAEELRVIAENVIAEDVIRRGRS
jgi:AbrB family looped-hinge helix DNA binding protein